MLAQVVRGGQAGLAGAGLVGRPDPELVDHVLLEPVDLDLRVCVRGLGALGPHARELVLELDDVVGDGPPAVLGRRLPLEHDHLVVVVDDFGRARRTGFI